MEETPADFDSGLAGWDLQMAGNLRTLCCKLQSGVGGDGTPYLEE